eukprot:scaffold4177_cov69-Cylindrotheca_fusiformis.AAC.2
MGTGGTGTGDSNNNNSIPLLGVWFHTVILYTGPIVASLVRTYEIRSQSMARRGNTTTPYEESSSSSYPMAVWRRLVEWNLRPLFCPPTNAQKWIQIRNFIVAPWTEEIIFRGCMVPVLVLLATSSTPKMTPLQVSIIAPLFFGFAHVHHAAQRWSKGDGLMKCPCLDSYWIRIGCDIESFLLQFHGTSRYFHISCPTRPRDLLLPLPPHLMAVAT